MKLKYKLLVLLCTISADLCAQNYAPPSLYIGDPAPPLRVGEWIKGAPVQRFEKGKVYIVEFWATWCAPCMASLPHLSKTARKYREKVNVLALDVYERRNTTKEHVTTVVDRMGDKMDFSVALEDTSFTAQDWLKASNTESIPCTFIVDKEGKVAWTGYPANIDKVLPQILKDTWDLRNIRNKELSKANFNKYLSELNKKASEKLQIYEGDYYALDDLGKPDSALLVINEMVTNEPKLKYAPLIAAYTFTALLKTDQQKAYEYGKEAIMTSAYYDDWPAYSSIIGGIKDYSRKLELQPQIYRLGAEAYGAEIDHSPYPELFDRPKIYSTIANWYWLAGDKSKALKARRKAIKLTKIALKAAK